MYEVFCKTHDATPHAKRNQDMLPFLKHMVKQTKHLEENLTQAEYADHEGAQNDRKSFSKLRKELKDLVKHHYSKHMQDKDKAIHSLNATVARLQADLQQREAGHKQEFLNLMQNTKNELD